MKTKTAAAGTEAGDAGQSEMDHEHKGPETGGETTGGELHSDLDAIIPGAEPQPRLADPRTPAVRRTVIRGLVAYVKTNNLAGKGRDDAAAQFLAGAICAADALEIEIIPPSEPVTYLACLEALAD